MIVSRMRDASDAPSTFMAAGAELIEHKLPKTTTREEADWTPASSPARLITFAPSTSGNSVSQPATPGATEVTPL